MKLSIRVLFCAALFCWASVLFGTPKLAAQEDAEGCKDSPLITRFPGGSIHSCENKEFEQADFPLGRDKDGNEITKHLEGEYHYWDMGTREGVSEIQVFRNFQNAIKNAGFIIDYAEPTRYIVGHKGGSWIMIDNKGDYYYQTIITVKDMQQEVTADASSLSSEIEKSGHVAVYGISFDTGKATIQPDSEKVLSQIVTLLKQSPDLKLLIEGHTDNQGTAAANQVLSEKRAQAVVAWLTAHGIAAGRLAAKGLGQTKPVVDNGSEDGRAKNRRVELVKTN
jgi:OOP family OmpA-OmpF porin